MQNLTNSELVRKFKEAEDYDSTLIFSALICERAGLAEMWARAVAAGAPADFDSVLSLAIERLNA